ncbi:MAG TPA: HD-GYP domain-containing protein [Gaiellaceae bacterium]|nr:HD-GYP domain-containing protein [Gaiellaceae bacterium]
MTTAAAELVLPPQHISPMRPAAWAYWLAVVLPATAAVLIAVGWQHGGEWRRFGVLAGAAAVAQLTSIQLTHMRVFHPAILFVVGGALLLPPNLLVLLCVLHCIPDWIKQRYQWYVQTFNIANYVLAGLAAWAVLQPTGFAGGGAREAAIGAGAAGAFILVNRLLLLPMLCLGRNMAARETGLLDVEDVSLELVLALTAVPLAALWASSTWLVVLALAPLVLIHLTQRAFLRLELASGKIREQNEALEQANQEVIERSTAALEALSATVDARDAYTAGHSRRVRAIASAIATELGLGGADLELVAQAALLHDVGKVAVPDAVLLKGGALTQTEWTLMRSHPVEGARIIERLGYLDEVVPAIRHHHERPDGRGYPDGLCDEEIPLFARIIHVADAIDAMTTQRIYRDALSFEAALGELRAGSGTNFSEECVAAFERAAGRGVLASIAPRIRVVAA